MRRAVLLVPRTPVALGRARSPSRVAARCRARASGVIKTRNPASGAPAEVEVLRAGVQPFVEEAGALPRVSRDQHGSVEDTRDLDHAVELSLVDLAGLQRSVRVTEPVGGHPTSRRQPRLAPSRRSWPDDTDVLDAHPDGGLDQPGDGIGVQRGVVVQHQDVVGCASGGDLERGADDPARPAVARVSAMTRRSPSACSQELARTIARRVVDRQDPHSRVGLRAERRQAPRSQAAASRTTRTTRTEGARSEEAVAVGRSSHATRSRAAGA